MDLGISQVLCSLVFFSFLLSPELISVFAMKERDPHTCFQLLLQLHPTCLKHTLLNTCSGPGVVDTSTWRKLDEPKMSAYCVRNVMGDREQRRKRAGRGWGSVMEQVMRTEIPALALPPASPSQPSHPAAGGILCKSDQVIAGLQALQWLSISQSESQSLTMVCRLCLASFSSTGLCLPFSVELGRAKGQLLTKGMGPQVVGEYSHLTCLRGNAGLEFLHFPFSPLTKMAIARATWKSQDEGGS